MADDETGYLPLSEIVYRKLRRSIIHGGLSAGTAVSEGELSRQLGVSKTPVRHALTRLAQEALIISTPHKGAVVAKVDRSDIEEIYRLRMHLEGLAARMAAERVSDPHAKRLQAIVDELHAATAVGDTAALRDKYVLLHQAIWQASGTRRLPTILLNLQDYVEMSRYTLMFEPSGLEVGFEEHARIVRAILARVPEEAEHAMVEHIAHTIALVGGRGQRGGAPAARDSLPTTQGG